MDQGQLLTFSLFLPPAQLRVFPDAVRAREEQRTLDVPMLHVLMPPDSSMNAIRLSVFASSDVLAASSRNHTA